VVEWSTLIEIAFHDNAETSATTKQLSLITSCGGADRVEKFEQDEAQWFLVTEIL